MSNIENLNLAYAQQRILKIKKFYHHLGIFLIVNTVLMLTKNTIAISIFGEKALVYPEIMNWVYWNIFIWAFIVGIHALIVFGKLPKLVRNWEQRQIDKYLEEDINESKKYR